MQARSRHARLVDPLVRDVLLISATTDRVESFLIGSVSESFCTNSDFAQRYAKFNCQGIAQCIGTMTKFYTRDVHTPESRLWNINGSSEYQYSPSIQNKRFLIYGPSTVQCNSVLFKFSFSFLFSITKISLQSLAVYVWRIVVPHVNGENKVH